MSDLALIWSPGQGGADLVLEGAVLATDAGLRTAVILSLFTDRRAAVDDVLPSPGAGLRGWWGDVAPTVEGDQIGSRLWQLSREKRTAQLLVRVREYVVEALAWMTQDGVAGDVAVETAFHGDSGVAIGVVITRPTGPTRQRYDFVWETL